MQGLLARILGRNSEPAPEIAQPETIGRAFHDKIVAQKDVAITKEANAARYYGRLAGEWKEKCSQEEVRADLAEQSVRSLLDEIKSLRPDAEAHRARLSRDRDYHRVRRQALASIQQSARETV